jgi:hypothetical protein
MQTVRREGDDVRRQIAILMNDIETLRDETKLQMQMHHAGMELRDRWNHFEHRHVQLRSAVRLVRDQALPALRGALMDHRAELADLHEELRDEPT